MITINTYDLLVKVFELIQADIETVSISIIDEDSKDGFISFSAQDDDCEIDFEELVDINSEEYEPLFVPSPDGPAPHIPTFSELGLIHSAFGNAFELAKEYLEKTSISAEERSIISRDLKSYERYLNNLTPFLDHFSSLMNE